MNYYDKFENIKINLSQRQIIANIIRDGKLEVSSEFQENLKYGFSVCVFDDKSQIEKDDISSELLNIIGDAICQGRDYGFFSNENCDMFYDWSLEMFCGE